MDIPRWGESCGERLNTHQCSCLPSKECSDNTPVSRHRHYPDTTVSGSPGRTLADTLKTYRYDHNYYKHYLGLMPRHVWGMFSTGLVDAFFESISALREFNIHFGGTFGELKRGNIAGFHNHENFLDLKITVSCMYFKVTVTSTNLLSSYLSCILSYGNIIESKITVPYMYLDITIASENLRSQYLTCILTSQ